MSLPYFFEPSIPAQVIDFSLSEESSKHAVQVLRMEQGEQLCITDGQGHLHTASILQANKKHAVVRVVQTAYSPAPTRKLTIAISLLKNPTRFEWFLEKATEIGITEILPLLCSRTEHRHFRYDRMQGIVIAAMLQSQRVWLPTLHQPQPFTQLIPNTTATQKLIAHCEEDDDKTHLSGVLFDNNVLLLIGPEGDFSPAEIELAHQHNYKNVSLGNTRLRAETAGIVGATLIVNGQ